MIEHPEGAAPGGDPYYIVAAGVAADLPKLVLKHQDSFFVADPRGDFPNLPGSEFGFYVDGTRFLARLELRLEGKWPVVLNSSLSADTLEVAVDLANPDVVEGDRIALLGRTVRLARRMTMYENQLYQTFTVESFAETPHELVLSWDFESDFADVFEVRGFRRETRGTLLPVEHTTSAVRLSYRGCDGVLRTSHLLFDPAPSELSPTRAVHRLALRPGARVDLGLTVSAVVAPSSVPASLGRGEVMSRRREGRERHTAATAQIRTDHEYVNEWLARSRSDLHMLLTDTPQGPITYAGIPWYVAPFGRDSIIVALQLLPFEPEIARGTLRFLAAHQGRQIDDFTDQEPGKILHELRGGELAACREIAFIPYYGSVDATPLFVILLAEYLKWTHDRALALELWPVLERALEWMTGPGRLGDDDYLRYVCRSSRGLANQGWKDSFDAVMHADGRLAGSPIALVEVQAYLYAALVGAADVAEVLDRRDRVTPWRERARRLRERFERDFWMESEGYYALALDGEGQPCRVISSNPGHCLWAGIVDDARADRVGKRLLAEDLFSGWGLRTLSTRERRYNPMSYHDGSVWPHDTAIAALGLRRYGATEPFVALCTGLVEAALHCDGLRVPELFCGFPRLPGFGPTRYPVACSPQAWATGVVFHLLQGMLGLCPDARDNRLNLVDPVLPPWLSWIELHGLRLGDSSIDLLVSRGRHGAAVEVLDRRGAAEVIVRR